MWLRNVYEERCVEIVNGESVRETPGDDEDHCDTETSANVAMKRGNHNETQQVALQVCAHVPSVVNALMALKIRPGSAIRN